jgi:hypothetical protein
MFLEVFVLVALISFVIAAIVLLKFVKHTAVAIISIIGLFLVLNAAIGFLVYQDVMEIREKSTDSPDLFLLKDNNQIISGVALDPSISPIEDAVSPLSVEQLVYLNEQYDSGNKDEVLKEFQDYSFLVNDEVFKIVEFDISVIENAEIEDINVQMFTVKKSDILRLLNSEDVFGDMVNVVLEDEQFLNQINMIFPLDEYDIDIKNIPKDNLKSQLKENLKDFATTDEEAKGLIFMLAVGAIVQDNQAESVKYIYGNYKEGDIVIYPESITFSILKLSPKSVVEQVITQVNDKLSVS